MSSAEEPKPVRPATSGFAIASLVCGLLALILVLPLLGSLLALVFGLMALVRINGSAGLQKGKGLAAAGMASGGLAILLLPCAVLVLLPAVIGARDATRRNVSQRNMYILGRAAINYEAINRKFPPAGEGSNGERHRVSWRVLILPNLGEEALYYRFLAAGANGEFPEWDDPAIEGLAEGIPEFFRNPNQSWAANETNYLAVTGPGTIYDPEQFPRAAGVDDIYRGDGPAHTAWLVEADADQVVPWHAPRDWKFDPNDPKRGLGNFRPGGFLVLFADGHTQFISNNTDPAVLRAMMTLAGGEAVDGVSNPW